MPKSEAQGRKVALHDTAPPHTIRGLNMTYAIVKTGGKQYRVEPGASITVEKIAADEGSTVELDQVLLIADGSSTIIGTPRVEGAKVVAEVETQAKGDKIIVLKYKRKTRYAVKSGHRQQLTKLAIKEIVTGGSVAKAAPARRKRAVDGA